MIIRDVDLSAYSIVRMIESRNMNKFMEQFWINHTTGFL